MLNNRKMLSKRELASGQSDFAAEKFAINERRNKNNENEAENGAELTRSR